MGVTRIQFPNHNTSRPVEVHRFMYLCTFLHINQNNPDSGERVEVSHVCGRSLCVNPDHLSLESHHINNNHMFYFNCGSCFGYSDHADCVSEPNVVILTLEFDLGLSLSIALSPSFPTLYTVLMAKAT